MDKGALAAISAMAAVTLLAAYVLRLDAPPAPEPTSRTHPDPTADAIGEATGRNPQGQPVARNQRQLEPNPASATASADTNLVAGKHATQPLDVQTLRLPAEETGEASARTLAHNRLLALQQKLRATLTQQQPGDPLGDRLDRLRQAAEALLNDALFAARLAADPTTFFDFPEVSLGPLALAQLRESPSPDLPESYLAALERLLSEIDQADTATVTVAASLERRLFDLLGRRKHYSDNYFKTLLQENFADPAVSVEDKLSYHAPFVSAGDRSLSAYGVRYFEELQQEQPLTPAQEHDVEEHLERAREVIGR